jgi:hypothetical protein
MNDAKLVLIGHRFKTPEGTVQSIHFEFAWKGLSPETNDEWGIDLVRKFPKGTDIGKACVEAEEFAEELCKRWNDKTS